MRAKLIIYGCAAMIVLLVAAAFAGGYQGLVGTHARKAQFWAVSDSSTKDTFFIQDANGADTSRYYDLGNTPKTGISVQWYICELQTDDADSASFSLQLQQTNVYPDSSTADLWFTSDTLDLTDLDSDSTYSRIWAPTFLQARYYRFIFNGCATTGDTIPVRLLIDQQE